MFFILIKNYLRSKWASIVDIDLSFKKINRIKRRFNISHYIIDIDFLSQSDEFRTKNDLVAYYDGLMSRGDFEWNLSNYFLALIKCIEKGDKDGEKSLVGFIEYVIMTDRSLVKGAGFKNTGVRTFINSIKIKTISDIRNEKLDKLLPIK